MGQWLKNKIWAVVKTFNQEDHMTVMEEIKQVNEEAYLWIEQSRI